MKEYGQQRIVNAWYDLNEIYGLEILREAACFYEQTFKKWVSQDSMWASADSEQVDTESLLFDHLGKAKITELFWIWFLRDVCMFSFFSAHIFNLF